jgi:hypothetical protein
MGDSNLMKTEYTMAPIGSRVISAPCNVKQAISNLLIELEGDVHQIRYKPTQQKNSKAEKMFPGVRLSYVPKD